MGAIKLEADHGKKTCIPDLCVPINDGPRAKAIACARKYASYSPAKGFP